VNYLNPTSHNPEFPYLLGNERKSVTTTSKSPDLQNPFAYWEHQKNRGRNMLDMASTGHMEQHIILNSQK
jgi:hypothetical protein